EDDQDLLTATFETLAKISQGAQTTNQHDYLANDYFAVLPFEVDGARAKIRLVPDRAGGEGATRAERLAHAVGRGAARLELQIQRGKDAPWEKAASSKVTGVAPIDQRKLRFDPFRNGRG